MRRDINDTVSFAEQITKSEGLITAADYLKNGYEKSRAVPANVIKYAEPTIHEIYVQGLRIGLERGLEAGDIGHRADAVRCFEKIAKESKKPITAGNAVKYYNSHLPTGSMRLNESARLPKDAELNDQDKRLYTAAQNLGFRHARTIIEQLHPYVKDEAIDIKELQKEAAEIYKNSRSVALGK